ncbi:hypothetical protein R6Q57_018926 [Mikania cordata]
MTTFGVATCHKFFQDHAFEGCINFDDMEVSRRPYHRNCNCPLHKMVSHDYGSPVCHITNVSYPLKHEGSLAMTTISRNYYSPVTITWIRIKVMCRETSLAS